MGLRTATPESGFWLCPRRTGGSDAATGWRGIPARGLGRTAPSVPRRRGGRHGRYGEPPTWSTRVYLADLHGQIHRLVVSGSGARQWSVAHRLGGEHPIVTSPVVFPFPGRTEPHLLVVTGGDRRVRGTASAVVLLRDEGTRLHEVWRRTLSDGETPQGQPVVLAGGAGVEVVLATHSSRTEALSCDTAATTDGIARLRAFNGLTGAPLAGVVAEGAPVRAFGPGRGSGDQSSRLRATWP